LSEDLYLPVALNFPLDNVSVQLVADGTERFATTLSNLEADYTEQDVSWGYSYSRLRRELGPGLSLYIESVEYPFYQSALTRLTKYAGDYVYYSAEHLWYWGDGGEGSWQLYYENDGAQKVGEFLDANTAIDVRLVVQTAGEAYGGTVTIPLYTYSWDYGSSEFRNGDYFEIFTSNKGEQSYGYSSGYVIP